MSCSAAGLRGAAMARIPCATRFVILYDNEQGAEGAGSVLCGRSIGRLCIERPQGDTMHAKRRFGQARWRLANATQLNAMYAVA